jgi:2-polyprenyl-3-methyl-5-hydroxy-6-metoxy-1,4-benzoquinol methylase
MTEFDNPRDVWDARYRCEEYIFGTKPNAFLMSQENRLIAGSRVLAVADGEGRNGVWLAQRGCNVCAVDISSVAVEKAKKLAVDRRVEIEFVIADLMEWKWPEAEFDAVVCIFIQFASPRIRKKCSMVSGVLYDPAV